MYLAEGYRKRHCYDEVTMEVKDYRMGEQLGVLLVYELPDTIKMKETEAQSYVAVMDLVMQLQEELPKSIVYYGQECLEEKGEHFENRTWSFSSIYTFFRTTGKNILRQRRRLFINIKNNLLYNL